jgi:phenylalanyl-tRNA synthetase alpha chain
MGVFSGLGQTLEGGATSCRSSREPCQGGVGGCFGRKIRSGEKAALAKSLAEEKLDVTLPGRGKHIGRLHPSTQQLRRVLEILAEMGFQVFTSREVETDEIQLPIAEFPATSPCA